MAIINDSMSNQSIHPQSKSTRAMRERRAREAYQDATDSKRVGMFNPDARTKGQ